MNGLAQIKQGVGVFEQLESRLMLAGNVTVALLGGDVIITGDNAANQVEVRLLSGPGGTTGVEVVPLDGTRVRGGSSPVTVFGLTRDLRINLAGGDDLVRVYGNGPAPRDVLINGGLGHNALMFSASVVRDLVWTGGGGGDTVDVVAASVGRDVRVNGGTGNNTTSVGYSQIAGNLTVSGGNGADGISLEGLFVGKNALIAGGAGANSLNASDVQVGGEMTLRGQAGDDLVVLWAVEVGKHLRIALGGGHNTIYGHVFPRGAVETLDDVACRWDPAIRVGGDLVVETLAGRDTLYLCEMFVSGAARINTGPGDDTVSAMDLQVAGRAVINTDLGNDTVKFEPWWVGSSFGSLTLYAGPGDDVVGAFVMSVAGATIIDGGLGQDSWAGHPLNLFSVAPTIRGFERTPLPDLSVFAFIHSLQNGQATVSLVLFNGGGAPAFLGPFAGGDSVVIHAVQSADEVFGNGDDVSVEVTLPHGPLSGWLNPGWTTPGLMMASVSGLTDPAVRPYLVLKIDALDVLAEADETNNTFAALIPGIT